jgi:hypothetical protein
MEIDLSNIAGLYRKAHEKRHSSHEVRDRSRSAFSDTTI